MSLRSRSSSVRASAMLSSRCSRCGASRSVICAFLSRSKAVGAEGLDDLSGWIRSERVRYWIFICESGAPGRMLRIA